MTENSEWMAGNALIIAHRGASALAPENTMAAFRAALEMKADAIELDAKLSADGVIVVHHDSTLDRTTSGSGPLRSLSAEELRALDAGSSFGAAFAGERIPTLEEVFQELGESLLINVELTNYATPLDDLPERAVSLVRGYRLEERVLFSSFNPIAIRRTKSIAPEIPIGLLLLPLEPGWVRGLLRAATPYDALHPQQGLATIDLVAREHAKDKPINVWTVNDPERMRELLKLGVDGLITDVPDVAREALRNAGRSF
jgi:glycerophosphoryl diester phosphodiesterase